MKRPIFAIVLAMCVLAGTMSVAFGQATEDPTEAAPARHPEQRRRGLDGPGAASADGTHQRHRSLRRSAGQPTVRHGARHRLGGHRGRPGQPSQRPDGGQHAGAIRHHRGPGCAPAAQRCCGDGDRGFAGLRASGRPDRRDRIVLWGRPQPAGGVLAADSSASGGRPGVRRSPGRRVHRGLQRPGGRLASAAQPCGR